MLLKMYCFNACLFEKSSWFYTLQCLLDEIWLKKNADSYFQLVSKTQINNFYIFWLKLPTIFFIYSDNIHTYLIWTTYSVIDTDSYIYIYTSEN